MAGAVYDPLHNLITMFAYYDDEQAMFMLPQFDLSGVLLLSLACFCINLNVDPDHVTYTLNTWFESTDTPLYAGKYLRKLFFWLFIVYRTDIRGIREFSCLLHIHFVSIVRFRVQTNL